MGIRGHFFHFFGWRVGSTGSPKLRALRALIVRMGEARCVKRKVLRRGRRKEVEEEEEENGKGSRRGKGEEGGQKVGRGRRGYWQPLFYVPPGRDLIIPVIKWQPPSQSI